MGDSAMPSSIAEFLPTKVFCGPGGPSNFDPYVRARIGVANHTGSRQTKPNKGGGAAPAWDNSCDHEMKLPSSYYAFRNHHDVSVRNLGKTIDRDSRKVQ